MSSVPEVGLDSIFGEGETEFYFSNDLTWPNKNNSKKRGFVDVISDGIEVEFADEQGRTFPSYLRKSNSKKPKLDESLFNEEAVEVIGVEERDSFEEYETELGALPDSQECDDEFKDIDFTFCKPILSDTRDEEDDGLSAHILDDAITINNQFLEEIGTLGSILNYEDLGATDTADDLLQQLENDSLSVDFTLTNEADSSGIPDHAEGSVYGSESDLLAERGSIPPWAIHYSEQLPNCSEETSQSDLPHSENEGGEFGGV